MPGSARAASDGPSVAEIRTHCEMRLASLKGVRSDYEAEAAEIARFAQPARSRFLANGADRNGARRRMWNKTLFDPHGIEAFRTLTNGLTSGLSSASRPWFALRTGDETVMDAPGVRDWLSEVERRMYAFLAGTNFYGAVKAGYAELGLFGTAACVMVEHRQVGAVCHALTFGEYWIALGDTLAADTLYRLCPMTVRQAVDAFGAAVSPTVRGLYDRSQYEAPVEIYHAIEPVPQHDPAVFGSKPFRSVYWEAAGASASVLRLGGYQEQPFWAPRWDVCGGDTYGHSPGMEALPALRELQMQAKRRNEAIDQMVKPEKIVPPGVKLTGEPGRTVTAAGIDRDSVLIPYQMPYQAVAAIAEEMDKCRGQISSLAYAELFNAITMMAGVQPRTVDEIAARNEEKLTQLGPVIERVSNEKLQIAVNRSFAIMMRGGLLPPAPPALVHSPVRVEFISLLQQLQRMVGLSQIERVLGFVGNLAAVSPPALDMIDFDQTVDEYAERAGVPARILRPAAQVHALRAARDAHQATQNLVAAMPAIKDGAQAAQLLSQADLGNGENLLSKLMP